MTLIKTYQLQCDRRCGVNSEMAIDAQTARRHAYRKGWRRVKVPGPYGTVTVDHCPACVQKGATSEDAAPAHP